MGQLCRASLLIFLCSIIEAPGNYEEDDAQAEGRLASGDDICNPLKYPAEYAAFSHQKMISTSAE